MYPPQLKSNVISLDHHISQYATICQQLQAEVRNHLGGRLGAGSKTQKLGVLLWFYAHPGFCGPLGSEDWAALVSGGGPEGEAPGV